MGVCRVRPWPVAERSWSGQTTVTVMAAGDGRRRQGTDAFGEDAVVIADQDPQRGHENWIRWGEPKRAWLLTVSCLSPCRPVSAPVTLQQLTDQLDAL